MNRSSNVSMKKKGNRSSLKSLVLILSMSKINLRTPIYNVLKEIITYAVSFGSQIDGNGFRNFAVSTAHYS